MRRKPLSIALAGAACLAVGLAAVTNFLPAQPDRGGTVKNSAAQPGGPVNVVGEAVRADQQPLPISHVVLFTSGVGFFQRQGTVEGDTTVDLSVPVGDINDMLKSLVLRDLDGGQVRAVRYDSQDPVDKTLQGYAINLGGNPTYADILKQARGERVEVTWIPADAKLPNNLVGAVLSVEKQSKATEKGQPVEAEFLNLWADGGLRNIDLSEVTQVRFLNTLIAAEVDRALGVVAQARNTQQKTVTLQFTGQGRRQVQVGYVAEHPVWKTSYRLVLDGKAKPFLQGWAIVQNPTNEDWHDVHVGLVSGRPVSYRMDLYEPLYVDRPLVQLEYFANLKPRRYEGDLDDLRRDEAREAKAPADMPAEPGFSAPSGGFGGEGGRSKGKEEAVDGLAFGRIGQSVANAAQGATTGDQFRYVIGQTVDVPRQKSAMLPIVNTDVGGDRVSIYNEQNLAQHPMLGLRFKNTTDLHLLQGPVTVYDNGGYAGDALIDNLQPGEDRLLSYAVDLGTEIDTEAKQEPQDIVRLAILKGILHQATVQRQTKTYVVKNRSDKDRLVILEHPEQSPTWDLVDPDKAPSKSRNYYRFEVKVGPGETEKFPVVEERKVTETIALTNLDTQAMAVLIRNDAASPELKKALQTAIDLKTKLADTQQQISQLQSKIETISKDQQRQRENMKVIPQTEPVYKKYLDKFLQQEQQIDDLRQQIDELQATANRQRQAYEAYIRDLTVDGKKD